MKKFLLSLIVLASFAMSAQQRTCGFNQMLAQKMAEDPEFAARHAETREFLLSSAAAQYRINNDNNSSSPTVVITIPVVFHVLYKNNVQNISDAQINSQLTILNNDFRKLNADFSSVVPSVYQSLGADVEIMFCKATQDPSGNSTTGITRKSVPASFVFEQSYYQSAGQPAWNPTKYLNIWIGRFSNNGLLGFAYPPQAVGQAYDGLCIGDQFFGNTGTAQAPYNKGRTATHEIGHYLGLDHIWGPYEFGDCSANTSDGVADTPPTTEPYYGCPSYPDFTYACSFTGNGPMHMNYMDYTNDACMAFFTNGQKAVMQNTMATLRSAMLTSVGCSSLSVNDVEAIRAIAVYPNPVSQYFNISSPFTDIDKVEIFNTNGQLVKTQKLENLNNVIQVDEFEAGVYYLRIYNQGDFVKSDKIIKK